jgi:hypothetical protein
MQRYTGGYHPHKQGNGHQTHSNHDEHVKTIEKCREHLVDTWFSDSRRRVTTYRDHLSEKKSYVSIVRQARRALDALPSDSQRLTVYQSRLH